MSFPIAAYSYAIAAAAYVAAWGAAMRGPGRLIRNARVQLALAGSAVWAAMIALLAGGVEPDWADSMVIVLEFARYALWLVAMPALIGASLRAWFGLLNVALFAVALLLLPLNAGLSLLVLTFAGLVNVEQLLRNAPPELRRPVKFCVVALGGTFAYDLFLYSHQAVLVRSSEQVWALRGFADALLAVFLLIGLRHLAERRSNLYVSRQVAFFTTAFVAVGLYLLATAAAGYAVRTHGAVWGESLRILLFIGAGLVLAVLVVTESPWRRLRVFLSKHFYRAKYDYRLEWLRFVGTLESREDEDVSVTSVRAISQIVESPGGVVFLRDAARGPYLPSGSWSDSGAVLPACASVDESAELVEFLSRRQWVVDLREYRESPGVYGNIGLPDWLLRAESNWRIVSPLLDRDRLFGFLVLQAPPEPFAMNFEDRDLLRTVGRHVAKLLVLQAAERRLAEGRQFDAFNRFAAFVMHDLKNSVAQLQLLVSNAARHRNNPEFVNDAFGTIENTVARMTRLIEQLHAREVAAIETVLDPLPVLREALARAGVRPPAPLSGAMAEGVGVRADPERLGTVLDHVIRNAQDAAGPSGRVTASLAGGERLASIIIDDTGPGMDQAFIRERLFRPFDSTKGSKGMGVGAYQAREYVRRIGGDVEVQSSPGAGTRFIIRLPLCPPTRNAS